MTTAATPVDIAGLIAEGKKFAMIAIETSAIERGSEPLIEVSESCRVSLRPSVVLPDLWKKWLGTLLAESFERSNLVIMTTADTKSPGVLDGQSQSLEREAQAMLLGVQLHVVPPLRSGLILSGERRGGEVEIRSLGRLDPLYRVTGFISPCIPGSIMSDAQRIAMNLEKYHAHGLLTHARLRRGLHSWKKAIHEPFPDERLHEFVRSLDALMRLPIGGSRRAFIALGQVLIGRSASSEELLGELYDLRSCGEHMNDFEMTLAGYPPEGRTLVGLLRSCQAQVLARETYRRLLLSDELLGHYRDDAAIDRMWELDGAELRRLWGDPIDLDLVTQGCFLDKDTGDRPEPRLLKRA